jgi:cell division protein FtsW
MIAASARQASPSGAGRTRLPRMDYLLLFASLSLAALGLVMVASASITLADRELGQPFYYALRQAIYIGVGVLFGMGVYRLRLALVEQAGMFLLLIAFAMLLAVLVPGVGTQVNGSVRWLNTGLFRLQVSEPAKLMILIYLASYLARHGEEVRTAPPWSCWLPPWA